MFNVYLFYLDVEISTKRISESFKFNKKFSQICNK